MRPGLSPASRKSATLSHVRRRVGLLLKNGKPEAIPIAERLSRFLSSLGHDVLAVGGALTQVEVVRREDLGHRIDFLVVLGGDGTLLQGAHLVASHGIPILGVNLGRLGFLTSCAPDDAESALERALAGELPLEERLRLRCELRRPGGEIVVRDACNDAVLSQGALARLIEFEALLDDRSITRYRADGLIVATPTGSTAYNLAAGGPIVTPDLRAVVITPICPHTLTNRPVVAPASSRVTIRLIENVEHVLFTVDGQWGTHLGRDDRVEISQASPPLYLYRPTESHFDVLREKLRWGE
jgi:NAD+ kinase